MRVQTEEVFKNNFVIDVVGIGVKLFEFTSEELQMIIESDILNNYDCINHLTSMVQIEEGLQAATNNDDNIHLEIRLFLKTMYCDDSDAMLNIITGYLKNTFIKIL